MKRLSQGARIGIIFAITHASILITIITFILLNVFSIVNDYFFQYTTDIFFWFYTGYCTVGITLVKKDLFRTPMELKTDNVPTVTDKLMWGPRISLRALKFLAGMVYVAVSIANVVLSIRLLIFAIRF